MYSNNREEESSPENSGSRLETHGSTFFRASNRSVVLGLQQTPAARLPDENRSLHPRRQDDCDARTSSLLMAATRPRREWRLRRGSGTTPIAVLDATQFTSRRSASQCGETATGESSIVGAVSATQIRTGCPRGLLAGRDRYLWKVAGTETKPCRRLAPYSTSSHRTYPSLPKVHPLGCEGLGFDTSPPPPALENDELHET